MYQLMTHFQSSVTLWGHITGHNVHVK